MTSSAPKHAGYGITVALALAFAGVGVGVSATTNEHRIEQPYPFNHAVHTAEVDCVLCHQGVLTGARAGFIALSDCTSCHATPPGREPSAGQSALWELALAGDAPLWEPLQPLPDHVYFSHRRHVALGEMQCATCHGDVAHSTEPFARPAFDLEMPQCLDCHRREQVTQDCSTCHR